MTRRDVIEHTIMFDDRIDEESIQTLMNEMSQYPFVNLYLSAEGGIVSVARALVDYLNRRSQPDNISVRVFLNHICCSAGTLLLTDYTGQLYVTVDFRFFMFHSFDQLTHNIRKDDERDKLLKFLFEDNEQYYSQLKDLGLTDVEVQSVRDGNNVYVFRDDLKRLSRKFAADEEVETIVYYTEFEPPAKVIKKKVLKK